MTDTPETPYPYPRCCAWPDHESASVTCKVMMLPCTLCVYGNGDPIKHPCGRKLGPNGCPEHGLQRDGVALIAELHSRVKFEHDHHMRLGEQYERQRSELTAVTGERDKLREQLTGAGDNVARLRGERIHLRAEDQRLRERVAAEEERVAEAVERTTVLRSNMRAGCGHDPIRNLECGHCGRLAQMDRLIAILTTPTPAATEPSALGVALEVAEYGWSVIANAGQGDWKTMAADWEEGATKYREMYHRLLDLIGGHAKSRELQGEPIKVATKREGAGVLWWEFTWTCGGDTSGHTFPSHDEADRRHRLDHGCEFRPVITPVPVTTPPPQPAAQQRGQTYEWWCRGRERAHFVTYEAALLDHGNQTGHEDCKPTITEAAKERGLDELAEIRWLRDGDRE